MTVFPMIDFNKHIKLICNMSTYFCIYKPVSTWSKLFHEILLPATSCIKL